MAPELAEAIHRFRLTLEALPIVSDIEVFEESVGGTDAVFQVTTPQGTQQIDIEVKHLRGT